MPVDPSSATASIPGVAVPPGLQKVTRRLCTAPIKVVKCAPPTTPPGVLLVVHAPWNVTVYSADPSIVCAGAGAAAPPPSPTVATSVANSRGSACFAEVRRAPLAAGAIELVVLISSALARRRCRNDGSFYSAGNAPTLEPATPRGVVPRCDARPQGDGVSGRRTTANRARG